MSDFELFLEMRFFSYQVPLSRHPSSARSESVQVRSGKNRGHVIRSQRDAHEKNKEKSRVENLGPSKLAAFRGHTRLSDELAVENTRRESFQWNCLRVETSHEREKSRTPTRAVSKSHVKRGRRKSPRSRAASGAHEEHNNNTARSPARRKSATRDGMNKSPKNRSRARNDAQSKSTARRGRSETVLNHATSKTRRRSRTRSVQRCTTRLGDESPLGRKREASANSGNSRLRAIDDSQTCTNDRVVVNRSRNRTSRSVGRGKTAGTAAGRTRGRSSGNPVQGRAAVRHQSGETFYRDASNLVTHHSKGQHTHGSISVAASRSFRERSAPGGSSRPSEFRETIAERTMLNDRTPRRRQRHEYDEQLDEQSGGREKIGGKRCYVKSGSELESGEGSEKSSTAEKTDGSLRVKGVEIEIVNEFVVFDRELAQDKYFFRKVFERGEPFNGDVFSKPEPTSQA